MKSYNISFICLITLHDIQMFLSQALPQSGANAIFDCIAALIETDEYHIYEIFPVAIPHIKQANSLAIAVVATFLFTPLFNVIL